jgi:hypothetical protein
MFEQNEMPSFCGEANRKKNRSLAQIGESYVHFFWFVSLADPKL